MQSFLLNTSVYHNRARSMPGMWPRNGRPFATPCTVCSSPSLRLRRNVHLQRPLSQRVDACRALPGAPLASRCVCHRPPAAESPTHGPSSCTNTYTLMARHKLPALTTSAQPTPPAVLQTSPGNGRGRRQTPRAPQNETLVHRDGLGAGPLTRLQACRLSAIEMTE